MIQNPIPHLHRRLDANRKPDRGNAGRCRENQRESGRFRGDCRGRF